MNCVKWVALSSQLFVLIGALMILTHFPRGDFYFRLKESWAYWSSSNYILRKWTLLC